MEADIGNGTPLIDKDTFYDIFQKKISPNYWKSYVFYVNLTLNAHLNFC